jgi:hypothetical protein
MCQGSIPSDMGTSTSEKGTICSEMPLSKKARLRPRRISSMGFNPGKAFLREASTETIPSSTSGPKSSERKNDIGV